MDTNIKMFYENNVVIVSSIIIIIIIINQCYTTIVALICTETLYSSKDVEQNLG